MDLRLLDTMDDNDYLAELLDPAKYRGYLQTMAYFSNYSWRNVFLIFVQIPHATRLADFEGWKEQYGRTIIQGSKSIKINVPIEQKPQKKFIEKTDPNTGAAVLDENGKRIMEEILVETPVKFKPKRVFDITQTEGKPVPLLAGDVMSDELLRGVFTDVLKTMSALTKLNDYNGMIKGIVLDRLENIDSDKVSFISDSVSYVVCRRFGIEADGIDLSGETFIDANIIEIIGKQADSLITVIEDKFAVICKERGLNPLTLPKTADTPPKAKAQYTTEQHTEIIAGIEFSQYTVKPLTDGIDENEVKIDNNETIINSPAPQATIEKKPSIPPVNPKERSEPVEPPILKYPPDTSITIDERNQYGYTRPELLPLNKNRAVNLFRRDMTVYLLNKDNTEIMAHYVSDIQNHDGIFGIAYGVWQNSREYIALASGKPEDRLEARFIFDGGDSFAVYQTEPTNSLTAYKSYEELQTQKLEINRHNYNLVYTAPLPAPPSDSPAGLFMWVNADRPDDYNGRSLTISDVLSIKKDEIITSYYTNGRTFKELLSFLGEEGRINRRVNEFEEKPQPLVTDLSKAKTIKVFDVEPVPVENEQEKEAVISTVTEPQSEPPIITVQTSPPSNVPPIQTASPPPDEPPALPEIRSELDVYRLSAKQAEDVGGMDVYDLNRRMDIECAKVITEQIQKNKKSTTYDLHTPAEFMLERYGTERMKWVLSKHILARETGFSPDNLSWANAYLSENDNKGDENPAFAIAVHHAVLDAFIKEIRAILVQKPTFNKIMKEAKKKSEAHNKSNG